ncbi:hypothetical protein JR316_0012388 [Psilocybe cubensis]|uniref:Uncharacterized protein n=2 Tax=Psilocybe cubensis TaxID=181762 RepID=A0ACB8GIQ0_PSICU|nr:hypothetical protein JR316_0012388 [Psilocybe cubensis]KAH9475277.1 hypothetical protein JR316_0012388 [Psilocybe cubensis]
MFKLRLTSHPAFFTFNTSPNLPPSPTYAQPSQRNEDTTRTTPDATTRCVHRSCKHDKGRVRVVRGGQQDDTTAVSARLRVRSHHRHLCSALSETTPPPSARLFSKT